MMKIGCTTCGMLACVCVANAAHDDHCRFRRAIAGAVAIECDHGRDVCIICDPCTCTSRLQDRTAAWHAARYPNHDMWRVLVKAGEELGELDRAIIGQDEGREGRGDILQEAAQTILVIYTLIGRFFTGDLDQAIRDEIVRRSL